MDLTKVTFMRSVIVSPATNLLTADATTSELYADHCNVKSLAVSGLVTGLTTTDLLKVTSVRSDGRPDQEMRGVRPTV